jgi:hypothetical protein
MPSTSASVHPQRLSCNHQTWARGIQLRVPRPLRQPEDEPSIGPVLCPGRNRTVTEWALRGVDAPVAVARYTTGEVTLTDTPPSELKRALPDLPKLASELTGIVEAAHVIYDEHPGGDERPKA